VTAARHRVGARHALIDAIAGIEALESGDGFDRWRRDYRGLREARPLAVVFPRSTREVARVVAAAAAHGVGVTPQGGNTGMSLGASPDGDRPFILLNLARLDRIRACAPGAGTMIVEAGVTLGAARRAAAAAGSLLAISLGSEDSAMIGGVLATNAGGETVLRYGMARDQVLGVEAVMADGTVWSQLSTLRKNNGGYDVRHLLCGSEGTLGVITTASLRLHPPARAGAAALLALADLAGVPDILALCRETAGSDLSMFELIGGLCLDHACRVLARPRPFNRGIPDWSVLIELGCERPDGDPAARLAEIFARASAAGLVVDGVIAESGPRIAEMLRLRAAVGDAIPRLGSFFGLDTGVPTPMIPDFVRGATARLNDAIPGATPYVFGHAGDGNIHFCAILPPGAGDGARRMAIAAINAWALELGGSATAEHGIGRLHRDALAARLSPDEMNLLRRLKAALDPDNIMNPGAVLPDAPATKRPSLHADHELA
jgi:FAD/FMN-containing dehydrogenase